jgi:hypothetical protein
MGFKLATLVVIGTDCIGGCNSNYHTIMTTTEIPKHAGPMDKSGKNQFGPEKHWFTPDRLWYKILGLLYKRALFDLQFVHNLF